MILPQDPVQAAIVHSMNNYCYDDAIFLSERLFAEAPTDATLFLLGTCYYQSGRKSQAYRFLRSKGYPTARCKYLYSKCCYETGRLHEAEAVLAKSKSIDDFTTEYGDLASYAVSLLADVYRKTERHAKALEYYQASLSLNPFLWSSFSKICKLGGNPDPCSIFHTSHVPEAINSVKSVLFSPQTPQSNLQNVITRKTESQTSTPLHNTSLISLLPGDNSSYLNSMFELNTPDRSAKDSFATQSNIFRTPVTTPSFGSLPMDTPLPGTYSIETPSPGILDVPQAPTKKMSRSENQTGSKHVFGQSSTSNTKTQVMAPPNRAMMQSSILPRRRSKRILDSQNSSSVKENSKVQTRSKHSSPKSSVRKTKSTLSITKSHDDLNSKNKLISTTWTEKPSTITAQLEQLETKQKQSAGAFLSLLQDIGSAYCLAQSYKMKQAVEKYESIPYHQYKTGWVLAEVGKAYLEMSDYTKAEEIFKELRELEPHQVNGMETYSTVLFHLQREVALSTLAQEMVSIDKLCPQTWCVNGNCFSLQKEHETAIKFLQRAIQVDDNFAYAYTLLGHEYTLTEDYDKAMCAFRNALRVDSQHYNAWYGLGMIYYKKEKFNLAETHFRKALAINPQSAVLLCHIGLVQHALQRHDLALSTLNEAVELSPKNPLCLFHRASMLVANDRLSEALIELEALKILTPKESLVYFLIGKVHKKLSNPHLSMLNFSWATDLDPKGTNNHIKEAIDRRYVTDDDDDDHEFPSIDSSILLAPTPEGHMTTDTSMLMDSDDGHQLQANESDDSL